MENSASILPAGPLPQTAVGIVASFDFTRDRELWRWAPDEATLFISRTDQVATREGFAMVKALGDPELLRQPTREVLEIGAQSVIYLCTACSFIGGVDREATLRQTILDEGAPHADTTSGAAVKALRDLGVGHIAVAHPYIERVGERLSAFLADSGFKVLSSLGLGLQPLEITRLTYAETADLIRRADHPDAEAIFVSCTSVPTYDLIAPMEQELGKPIVSANQATMWSVLTAAGLRPVGPGQALLER